MHMMEEIKEEIKLAEKYEYYRSIGRELRNEIKNKRIIISGSGSSYNASVLMSYALMEIGNLANTIQSSEVLNLKNVNLTNTVSILFSHSGESSDIINAAKHLKKLGSNTISITDFENSGLSNITDIHINSGAGEEKAIAATKSHFAQSMIALSLIENDEFANVGGVLNDVMKNEKISYYAGKITDKTILLGTGFDYPLAMEGALKLQETSELITYHYPVREFLHGPIQILDKSWDVIFLSKNKDVLKRAIEYHSNPIIIGNDDKDDIIINAKDRISMYLGKLLVLQLLSYHVSVIRGFNPDSPSKLSKVVK